MQAGGGVRHSGEHFRLCKTENLKSFWMRQTFVTHQKKQKNVPLFFSLEKNLLVVGVEAAVVAVGFSVTVALVSLATAGSVGSAVGPAGATGTGTGCTSVDMVGAPQGKEEKGHRRLLKTREHVQLGYSATIHPQHWTYWSR